MGDIAIRVKNLGKQYRIGGKQERYRTLCDTLADTLSAPFRRLAFVVRGQSSATTNETIWALKDVSFEVQCGEVVGACTVQCRRHRAQRGGEDYSAQDPLPHHGADGGRAADGEGAPQTAKACRRRRSRAPWAGGLAAGSLVEA